MQISGSEFIDIVSLHQDFPISNDEQGFLAGQMNDTPVNISTGPAGMMRILAQPAPRRTIKLRSSTSPPTGAPDVAKCPGKA